MIITAAIMAHPKRAYQARALYNQLLRYPFYTSSLVWDEQNNEWDTGKRALEAGRIAGGGDWHVVIQDDAILTPDFYTNIHDAVNSLRTKTLISLYTGSARPIPDRVIAALNKARDGEWLKFHQLLWGVGIAIPSDHIEPMLEFVKDVALQYDNKIGEFYCQNALPVYYTVPSLVDHDDDLGSLIAGHGEGPESRKAHRLATGPVQWTDKSYYI